MADYISNHTGADIDAGITKTNRIENGVYYFDENPAADNWRIREDGSRLLFERHDGSANGWVEKGFFQDSIHSDKGYFQDMILPVSKAPLEPAPAQSLVLRMEEEDQGDGTKAPRPYFVDEHGIKYRALGVLPDGSIRARQPEGSDPLYKWVLYTSDSDKIRDALESLGGEDRLDASAIKNIPEGGDISAVDVRDKLQSLTGNSRLDQNAVKNLYNVQTLTADTPITTGVDPTASYLELTYTGGASTTQSLDNSARIGCLLSYKNASAAGTVTIVDIEDAPLEVAPGKHTIFLKTATDTWVTLVPPIDSDNILDAADIRDKLATLVGTSRLNRDSIEGLYTAQGIGWDQPISIQEDGCMYWKFKYTKDTGDITQPLPDGVNMGKILTLCNESDSGTITITGVGKGESVELYAGRQITFIYAASFDWEILIPSMPISGTSGGGGHMSAAEIRDELETLEGTQRLGQSAIKDLYRAQRIESSQPMELHEDGWLYWEYVFTADTRDITQALPAQVRTGKILTMRNNSTRNGSVHITGLPDGNFVNLQAGEIVTFIRGAADQWAILVPPMYSDGTIDDFVTPQIIRDKLSELTGSDRLDASAIQNIPEADTPVEVREKLESLTGTARLDASAIQNIPEQDIPGSEIRDKLEDLTGEARLNASAIRNLPTYDFTGEEVRDKLQGLVGDTRLDASAIKNIPIVEVQPDIVRDSLETLEGEDRLDASAIKNIPEMTPTSVRNALQTLTGVDRLSGAAIKDSERTHCMETTQGFPNDSYYPSGNYTCLYANIRLNSAKTTVMPNLGRYEAGMIIILDNHSQSHILDVAGLMGSPTCQLSPGQIAVFKHVGQGYSIVSPPMDKSGIAPSFAMRFIKVRNGDNIYFDGPVCADKGLFAEDLKFKLNPYKLALGKVSDNYDFNCIGQTINHETGTASTPYRIHSMETYTQRTIIDVPEEDYLTANTYTWHMTNLPPQFIRKFIFRSGYASHLWGTWTFTDADTNQTIFEIVKPNYPAEYEELWPNNWALNFDPQFVRGNIDVTFTAGSGATGRWEGNNDTGELGCSIESALCDVTEVGSKEIVDPEPGAALITNSQSYIPKWPNTAPMLFQEALYYQDIDISNCVGSGKDGSINIQHTGTYSFDINMSLDCVADVKASWWFERWNGSSWVRLNDYCATNVTCDVIARAFNYPINMVFNLQEGDRIRIVGTSETTNNGNICYHAVSAIPYTMSNPLSTPSIHCKIRRLNP